MVGVGLKKIMSKLFTNFGAFTPIDPNQSKFGKYKQHLRVETIVAVSTKDRQLVVG